ncbi:MAG TPA: MFS transporter, partial [Anaerolineae bacterium]|nr:MFS transporter [Anaerolineae bacterium]
GFAFISVLVLGVLNRVMYAEMGLPAILIGFLFAIPPAISPFRLWLGYLSDAHPILGHRRVPYIIGGMILAVAGVIAGTLGALWILRSVAWGVLITVIAFLGYGMGKNAMATTSQALIADVFDKQCRPQAMAILKATFILGIIGGSVGLGRLVDPYSPGRLIAVVIGTGVVAIVLSVVGCLGVEPTGQVVESVSSHVREMSFGQTLKQTLRNPQVRLFFFFISATLLATLAQDVYLEPYGAKVFGMSVGETARLNMYWGTGTLTAMIVCGLWLINRLGRKPVTAIGLVIVALSFVGLILAGGVGQKGLFVALVFLLGIGSGASGAGALTLMVDFTVPEQAGLLMGTWTIAHQLAEAIGNAVGGVLIDGVLALSSSHLAAFGVVFGLEVVAALAALALLSRISVAAFKARSSLKLEGSGPPRVVSDWAPAMDGEG